MKKKCNWCEKTTDASRDDFYKIKWYAVMLGNEGMICACPDHKKELIDYIKIKLRLNLRS